MIEAALADGIDSPKRADALYAAFLRIEAFYNRNRSPSPLGRPQRSNLFTGTIPPRHRPTVRGNASA